MDRKNEFEHHTPLFLRIHSRSPALTSQGRRPSRCAEILPSLINLRMVLGEQPILLAAICTRTPSSARHISCVMRCSKFVEVRLGVRFCPKWLGLRAPEILTDRKPRFGLGRVTSMQQKPESA